MAVSMRFLPCTSLTCMTGPIGVTFAPLAGIAFDSSLIPARLGDVEPVLGIHMREQGGTDVVRLERGFDDPEPRKRMLPLARQPSNGVSNLDGAFGAADFACNDVAVHVNISCLWFEPGSGRCYEREPLYIAKEKRRRPDNCSATG